MTKQRIMTDIPGNEVDEAVADFESEGCTVSKKQQDNGLWTVTADCPESR